MLMRLVVYNDDFIIYKYTFSNTQHGPIFIFLTLLHDGKIVIGGMIIIHVASNTKQSNLATIVEHFVALPTKTALIVCASF